MSDQDKIFILTDDCMWERNKQTGKADKHAIIVTDVETGQQRLIDGGAHIKFVSGKISEPRSQEEYNKQSNNE